MNDMLVMLEQYLRAAWRRRWLGVAIAWAACAVGWVGVYSIPNQFESSARLFVDADAVLTPLLRGIAADTTPLSQLDLLQRTLLSRPNLEKLISKTDLDLSVHSATDRDRLVKGLESTIKVTPQTRSLFTITYRNSQPKVAYDVVQTLLTIFIESATGNNRSDMENAKRFLQNQIASYQQQLQGAEKRRADFRSRYVSVLPESGSNVSGVEAGRARVQSLEGALKDATDNRNLLKQELTSTPPMLAESDVVRRQTRTKLQDAEEQLRLLLLRDTPNHPDVIAQKRLIASLKAAPPENASSDAAETGRGGGSRQSTPNPVYTDLKVKLVDADSQVMALKRQYDEAVTNLSRLEKILREQPGLMAEFQNMDRDYGVLRKNYEELLGRLQSANIAQAADTQADKVKILVVDPPQLPRLPVAPNRILLVTGVLIAGIGAGLGLTMVFGQFDKSFATPDDLRNLGLPVLGGISILGLAPLRQRLMVVARFGLALVVLVIAYGGLMVHILRGLALT
jgi:polysaccharide chain length determinant protein (PEP-CTERM system associated)